MSDMTRRAVIVLAAYLAPAALIFSVAANLTDSNPFVPALSFGLPFAIAAFLATATPTERAELLIRHFRWMPPAIGFLSCFYFYFYSADFGENVGGDFFSAVAQVIPVLLLALTIDVRQSATLRGPDIAGVVAASLVGESVALSAAAFSELASRADFAIAAGAIMTLGIALLMALGSDIPAESDPSPPPT